MSCLALQNPFGAAKPRETVLAAKSGKSEKDILAEEAAKAKLNVGGTLGMQSHLNLAKSLQELCQCTAAPQHRSS